MSKQPQKTDSGVEVKSNLQELAQLLRQADHLEPDAQRELADLVDELAKVLGPVASPSAETKHLTDNTAHLVHALHQQHPPGLLAAARKRLEESALRAESEAPLATGIVRRLLDALANLGI